MSVLLEYKKKAIMGVVNVASVVIVLWLFGSRPHSNIQAVQPNKNGCSISAGVRDLAPRPTPRAFFCSP